MKIISVGEFKAQFSSLLREVLGGKEIGISYGRKREAIAVLIPYHKKSGKRRPLGLLARKKGFCIHADFEISDEEFLGS